MVEPDLSDLDRFMDGDPFDPVQQSSRETKLDARTQDREAKRREALEARRRAYVAVFRDGNSEPYQRDIVLADLTMFCRGNVSAFNTDARVHALLTGRQETWLRIQDHIGLSLDDLLRKLDRPGN